MPASPGDRVVCQAALNHSDNVPTMNNWGGKKAHLGLWFLSMTGLHHRLGASSEADNGGRKSDALVAYSTLHFCLPKPNYEQLCVPLSGES